MRYIKYGLLLLPLFVMLSLVSYVHAVTATSAMPATITLLQKASDDYKALTIEMHDIQNSAMPGKEKEKMLGDVSAKMDRKMNEVTSLKSTMAMEETNSRIERLTIWIYILTVIMAVIAALQLYVNHMQLLEARAQTKILNKRK